MKFKTTAKAIRDGYYTIIGVGYCDLQNLLKYKDPVAYTCGVYGWSFDVYDIDRVAICTGYRVMPSKNSSHDYKLIREYDKMAEGKTEEELNILIKEFIKVVSK